MHLKLGTQQKLQSQRAGLHMGAHYARDRAFVGDRQRAVAQRCGSFYQFFRLGGAALKAEIAQAMQFRIGGGLGIG